MSSVRTLGLTLVFALAGVPSAFAQAGRIDTISPAMARPGDQVTITGNGFGGPNVRILVGGVAARVVSANGNRATFVVPAGARIGATTVSAMNPGGRSGSIGFRVLLQLTIDSAAAAQAVIGPDGGTVTTTRGGATYELSIPPGAIDGDTPITLTPVVSMTNLPFSGGVVAAAQFEPSGLALHLPATLTITLPSAMPDAGLFGFLVDNIGLALEVVRREVTGTTLKIEVNHFSAAGGAVATLQDFEQQVLPLLNALPPTLPPTQVVRLTAFVGEWMAQFGPEICLQTDLCRRVFDIAMNSLETGATQACDAAQASIDAGNPFSAHEKLSDVEQIAVRLLQINLLAAEIGLTDLEQTPDLLCIPAKLHAIVDLARTQALDNPRAGLLVLLFEIAGDAQKLTLDDEADYALSTLLSVVNTLMGRADLACVGDPDDGEFLLNVITTAFPNNFLNGIDGGLADRVNEVFAGCRVRISPALPTVTLQQTLQFTGVVVGLSPATVTWSLASAALGSTIDSTGLFTAGQTIGTVIVQATSVADPTRFKKTTVTIVDSCSATVAAVFENRPRFGPFVDDDDPPVCIAVDPSSTTVAPEGTQQFTVTVIGGTNQQVVWSVTGNNTIDENGLLTAGTSEGTFTVRAASVVDATVFGEATVTVVATLVITPLNAAIETNQARSFAAQLQGAPALVTWSATGGTITPGPSASAIYTAGNSAGTFSITATRVDDPTKSQTIAVIVNAPALFSFTFDDGLQGWAPSCVLGFTCQQGPSVSGRVNVVHLGNSEGQVVSLDGVGNFLDGSGNRIRNSSISRGFALPAAVTTLEFDVSGHNRDGADSRLVVRIVDAGVSTALIDETVQGTGEGTARVLHHQSVDIAAWAGRTVTIFFEQYDNGFHNPETGQFEFPGRHEQVYLDNVRIR